MHFSALKDGKEHPVVLGAQYIIGAEPDEDDRYTVLTVSGLAAPVTVVMTYSQFCGQVLRFR